MSTRSWSAFDSKQSGETDHGRTDAHRRKSIPTPPFGAAAAAADERAHYSSRSSTIKKSCARSSTRASANGSASDCWTCATPTPSVNAPSRAGSNCPREALHRWDNDLCRVLDGKADEKMVSVLLAIMLDGFPRGMIPNVQTYADAALLALGETVLSPQVLAAAIVRIWRKDRFPPTIADLLEECERARQAALNARRVVVKMITLLDNAEEAIIASDSAGDGRKRAGP